MSKVYYVKVEKGEEIATLTHKTIKLLQKIPSLDSIKKNDFVGIKTHFGEKDNTGHIKPVIVGRIAEFLQQKSDRVFVTDTNTLYLGSRSNAIEHIKLAYKHNFGLSQIGIPIIIADGLRGRNYTAVKIPGEHLHSVKIASDIVNTDFLLCLSHMTGHMQTGFGASLKNLGMGCASRAGKLEQHSDVLPSVIKDKCEGCGMCVKWCPTNAIDIEGGKANIVQTRCIGCGECTVVCKNGAIKIKWSINVQKLQEKMVEYALGVIKAVGPGRMGYINFLTHITKDCDCMSKNEPAICDDIGIMASHDPVALDNASVDMAIKMNRKDIFKIGYPEIDWSIQLKHAEVIGIGKTAYEIEEL